MVRYASISRTAIPFLLLLHVLPLCRSLVLDLPSGRVKCLMDDLRYGTLSLASYHLVSSSSPSLSAISAKVSGPNGEEIHLAEDVKEGEFSFRVETTGKHTLCFWSSKFELGAVLSVDVNWRFSVLATAGWSRWATVAKQGEVEAIDRELKKLENTVKLVHEEMTYLRERDDEARTMNEETARRMHTLSLFSFILCWGVAGLQLWYMKSFFQGKKIL